MAFLKKPTIWVLLIVAALVASGASLFSYLRFHSWITADIHSLESYPTLLIRSGERVPHPQLSDQIAAIDEALIGDIIFDRIVVDMSRSEIRFSLLGDTAYAKVVLKTAVPKEEERVRRAKFLTTVSRENGRWRVKSKENINVE
ncbi:MAG: hypothetical protein V2A74_06240 [bacterium]